MKKDTKEKKRSVKESDSFSGIILLSVTILALILANTSFDTYYEYFLYQVGFGEQFNIHFLINDFLMAMFFLVVGCEIKREIVLGKLSTFKQASFPVITAIGGMVVPALIFTLFNYGSEFQNGVGIPLSTDIAFAIGIFAILKHRLNPSLKLFLLTLAVVDDLLSIVIIALFYTDQIRVIGIMATAILIAILLLIRKIQPINNLYTYLIFGLFLWIAVLYSGIHATLSGVILAFCIPVYDETNRQNDLSYKLQHGLEGIANLVILPLFAFANTGIKLGGDLNLSQNYTLMMGIILGLVVGKPLGITLFGYIADILKVTNKPEETKWDDLFVVSIISGIGFTISLFISEIAFSGEIITINVAKISILISAMISTILAFVLAVLKTKKFT